MDIYILVRIHKLAITINH